MVIKASAAAEIRQLIAALGAEDDVRREAAIARLAVLGPRAVDRLIAAYEPADRETRIAILRALESVGDRRLVPVARLALSAGGDLGVAAASALRALLDSPHGSAGTEALDLLVATALDSAADRRVRLASFEALQDMPPGVQARVAEALQADPDPGLKSRAVDLPRDTAAAEAVWQDALEGRLPDAPGVLREAAQLRAQSAALSALQRLIDAIRAREGSVRAQAKRTEWQGVRGALHQALALRGSRVAVYDLRETIEASARPGARLVPRRPARRRRRVVPRAAGGRVLQGGHGRRAVAPPAQRGVPRDRPPREGHAAARGDEADRGALAGCRARSCGTVVHCHPCSG